MRRPARCPAACLPDHQVGGQPQAQRVTVRPLRDRHDQRPVDVHGRHLGPRRQVRLHLVGPESGERQLLDRITGYAGRPRSRSAGWARRAGSGRGHPRAGRRPRDPALRPLERVEHAHDGFRADRVDDAGEVVRDGLLSASCCSRRWTAPTFCERDRDPSASLPVTPRWVCSSAATVSSVTAATPGSCRLSCLSSRRAGRAALGQRLGAGRRSGRRTAAGPPGRPGPVEQEARDHGRLTHPPGPVDYQGVVAGPAYSVHP